MIELEFSGIFWNFLEFSGIFWNVLEQILSLTSPLQQLRRKPTSNLLIFFGI